MSVELCNESVAIRAVNDASLLDGLASRMRAAKAMHSYLKEKFSCFNIVIKNVADEGLFCDYHFSFLPF